MTTVAVDVRTLEMCADKQANDRGVRTSITKIRKIVIEHMENSSVFLSSVTHVLVGVAGECQKGEEIFNWVRHGMPSQSRPKFAGNDNPDVTALVLCDDGRLYHIETDCVPCLLENEVYYAIGTGAMAAMSVFRCGLDVHTAVKVACEVDPYSGGGIDLIKLS